MKAKTKTDHWLLPVLMKSEFKRWQAPPILKVSKHSFGRGRRWPIAHQAKE
jgi:NAD+ synthase (glutamine-hydrolysing)